MVLWGMDTEGNVLWIFTRSPFTVHDFANTLLSLNLKIDKLMYLEGGPEASFYLNHPKSKLNHNRYQKDTNQKTRKRKGIKIIQEFKKLQRNFSLLLRRKFDIANFEFLLQLIAREKIDRAGR